MTKLTQTIGVGLIAIAAISLTISAANAQQAGGNGQGQGQGQGQGFGGFGGFGGPGGNGGNSGGRGGSTGQAGEGISIKRQAEACIDCNNPPPRIPPRVKRPVRINAYKKTDKSIDCQPWIANVNSSNVLGAVRRYNRCVQDGQGQ